MMSYQDYVWFFVPSILVLFGIILFGYPFYYFVQTQIDLREFIDKVEETGMRFQKGDEVYDILGVKSSKMTFTDLHVHKAEEKQ